MKTSLGTSALIVLVTIRSFALSLRRSTTTAEGPATGATGVGRAAAERQDSKEANNSNKCCSAAHQHGRNSYECGAESLLTRSRAPSCRKKNSYTMTSEALC